MNKLDRINKETTACAPEASKSVNGGSSSRENGECEPCRHRGTGIGQEINLVELSRLFWKSRMFFLKLGAAALVIGLIVAYSIPKEYTTCVKLAPEMEDASKRIGNLGGLAAMAGINLNTATGSDALSPDLYPDVVQSTPFLLELYPVEVTCQTSDSPITFFDYMHTRQKSSWWSYVVKLPFRAIGAVRKLFAQKEPAGAEVDPFRLTEAQETVLQAAKNRINVAVDKNTLVISICVEMQDPDVSAEVARVVVERLQNYITAYRTRKAKNDLSFTRKIFEEAQEAYFKAQRAYAAFEDANRNLISASYRTEQERLKNEMTLTFNVYNSLAQKLEQDKLRVQEQTPVYTVIEPATVPLRASSPKKALVLIGFLFLALFGGIAYRVIRESFFPEEDSKEVLMPEVQAESTQKEAEASADKR